MGAAVCALRAGFHVRYSRLSHNGKICRSETHINGGQTVRENDPIYHSQKIPLLLPLVLKWEPSLQGLQRFVKKTMTWQLCLCHGFSRGSLRYQPMKAIYHRSKCIFWCIFHFHKQKFISLKIFSGTALGEVLQYFLHSSSFFDMMIV